MYNHEINECMYDEKCSYLDNKEQRTHYRVIQNVSKDYSSKLIESGWRRFGEMYFRPVCNDCNECQSIKIDVDNYLLSKSSRRILKKASNLEVKITRPRHSLEHIELFNIYHRYMKEHRDWEQEDVDLRHYYNSFVKGYCDFGFEVSYYDEEKLIAVDLIDILDEGISSIYFYYDPEYKHLSLGKFSIYKQIEFAKKLGLHWIYLGYYVEENQSLSYKSQFKPYKTLEGRPDVNQNVEWY